MSESADNYIRFLSPDDLDRDNSEAVLKAATCLDAFTDRFNACDVTGMDAYLHFPHVMYSGSEIVVWKEPRQLSYAFFDRLKATGWAATIYLAKKPILATSEKVHFFIVYTRNRADGTIISRHQNLWIVTEINGKWGIARRSY